MKALLLFLITLYQRWISPYKGFRCAHAGYYRGVSCSHAVKAIIAEHGWWRGYPLVRQRFAECRSAARLLREGDKKDGPKKPRRRRRADGCDPDCCMIADFSDIECCASVDADCCASTDADCAQCTLLTLPGGMMRRLFMKPSAD